MNELKVYLIIWNKKKIIFHQISVVSAYNHRVPQSKLYMTFFKLPLFSVIQAGSLPYSRKFTVLLYFALFVPIWISNSLKQ